MNVPDLLQVAPCHNMGVVQEMKQQDPPLQQPSLAPHHDAKAEVTDGTDSTATLHDRLAELQNKFDQQRKVSHLDNASFQYEKAMQESCNIDVLQELQP